MDIFELQITDHRRFLHFLDVLSSNKDHDSYIDDFYKESKLEILSHSMAEEEILFSLLKEHNDSFISIIQDIKSDHKEIEDLFDSLSSKNVTSSLWSDQLNLIKDVLRRDIYKEETILLPEARKMLSDQQAINMANNMSLRKCELKNSLFSRIGHRILEKID